MYLSVIGTSGLDLDGPLDRREACRGRRRSSILGKLGDDDVQSSPLDIRATRPAGLPEIAQIRMADPVASAAIGCGASAVGSASTFMTSADGSVRWCEATLQECRRRLRRNGCIVDCPRAVGPDERVSRDAADDSRRHRPEHVDRRPYMDRQLGDA